MRGDIAANAGGANGALLSAIDIHKKYTIGRRNLEVLRGIDLTIDRGEFVALQGASGAGKSTLLHLLGGLDTPNQGKIILAGSDLVELSSFALARLRNLKVGFCLPARIARVPGATAYERACQLLERVGLAERIEHKPFELSGGEQQRVAIARALINSPDIVLADEPTGNLDSHTGEEIINLLCALRTESNTTLIIATHDSKIAARAPSILNLVDGRIAMS
ncbi:MAG: ABC transporter [Verrucomicrobia bacterium]|nr:MAG: ABC transporter [Verrucomicrobiota bacterium]